MKIFTFFKPADNNRPLMEANDMRTAECPYCQRSLQKVPAKKTKCPHCGEFMFVRTRPKDNARVVVTKEEAERIEEDWSIVSGTHENYILEKERVVRITQELKKQFGKDPSENDVRWRILNEDLLQNAREQNWGFYRNTRFEMAEILRKEMKFELALITYLEVCYIDLNGPNNNGGMINDPEFLKEQLPFDTRYFTDLAPGVISLIEKTNKKVQLNNSGMKELFISHASNVQKSLKLPVSVEAGWLAIEKELTLV